MALRDRARWVRPYVLFDREVAKKIRQRAKELGYRSLAEFLRILVNHELKTRTAPSFRELFGRSRVRDRPGKGD